MSEQKLAIPRDGKSNFYRKLNLDKSTMKLIRNYRQIKSLMDKDETENDREIIK